MKAAYNRYVTDHDMQMKMAFIGEYFARIEKLSGDDLEEHMLSGKIDKPHAAKESVESIMAKFDQLDAALKYHNR